MNITEIVSGKGNKLYVVTFIDTEDVEFSVVELWKANDDDHLYDQILEEMVEDNILEEEMIKDDLDSKWGYSILIKEIGEDF